MFRSRPFRVLLALLAVLLVAASCSSRDDSDSSSGGGGSSTTEASDGGSGGIDTADCPPDTNTAGIDGDTITLASSFPQSGLTAAFAEISKGYKAYFQMVNEEEGGVDIGGKKYKIEVKDKDDE